MEDDLLIEKLMLETYDVIDEDSSSNVVDLNQYFDKKVITNDYENKIHEFLHKKEIKYHAVIEFDSFYRIENICQFPIDIPKSFSTLKSLSENEFNLLFINKENDESMFYHALRPEMKEGMTELIFIKYKTEILMIPLMDYHLRFKGEILSFFDDYLEESGKKAA
tara:strand:- start:48327 stop:48821 length:495 start_codon:yes stop_codon:yes gene_type:complete